jgi:hypothetical protein
MEGVPLNCGLGAKGSSLRLGPETYNIDAKVQKLSNI